MAQGSKHPPYTQLLSIHAGPEAEEHWETSAFPNQFKQILEKALPSTEHEGVCCPLSSMLTASLPVNKRGARSCCVSSSCCHSSPVSSSCKEEMCFAVAKGSSAAGCGLQCGFLCPWCSHMLCSDFLRTRADVLSVCCKWCCFFFII